MMYRIGIIGLAYFMPLPASAQETEWAKMPRMQLERQFAGPLQATVIQRWRDPVDGTVCYIYLPFTASHSAPGAGGFVQYGPNTIGSLSCVPGVRPSPVAAAKPAAPPAAAPKPTAPKGETSPQ